MSGASLDRADWMEDSYPTDAALKRVKEWDYHDFKGLMEFLQSIWQYADWGWHMEAITDEIRNEPVNEYSISTAGWSGNEELICAMKENTMFWMLCWVQSRRGGHYIFHLPIK